MKNKTQDEWISECATYLVEKRDSNNFWERPKRELLTQHKDNAQVFHDFESLRVEIKSATKDLQCAYKTLANLRRHFAQGELVPFDSVSRMISAATTGVAKASAELANAADRLSIEHPQRTRALTLQRSAVTMAYALLGSSEPRKVRSAAKKMLQMAGIQEPDERSLSTWIKEEKDRAENQQEENSK